MNSKDYKLMIAFCSFVPLIAIAMVLMLMFLKEEPVVEQEVISEVAYIVPPPMQKSVSPVTFSDVTAQTGIDFKHYTGAFVDGGGEQSRYMPETMGPGVVLFDYDNDDDLDLFITNSAPFQKEAVDKPISHLYRNDGGFRFTDVSRQAGLMFTRYCMGATAADYDGDGYQDLLVTSWGAPMLLHNRGNGTFEDVTHLLTREDGSPLTADSEPAWSTGAAFFDADGDADLDLYVLNYVRWSPAGDLFATVDGKRKSYATPNLYQGMSSRLYVQENGRFIDRTAAAGLLNAEGKSLGVALWDFNNDGKLDIAVANDTQPNFLYINNGDGTFEDQGLTAGIAYDENGRTRAGMGVDIADFANDGSAAIVIGNFSREPVSVFKQQGPGFFRESSQQTGVAGPTYLALTFGLLFADMDLDGWQDLVLTNGHIEPNIQDVESEISYRQPPALLGNARNGRFEDWSGTAGSPFQKPIVGRGLAVGDLDGDGDLDIITAENNGPVHVFRNDADLASRNYLRVSLHGSAPNTDAIGAKIELLNGNIKQQRIIRNGSSYLSQAELTQTFGLGDSTRADKLVITWPSGKKTELDTLPANQTLVVDESSGSVLAAKGESFRRDQQEHKG